MSQSHGSSPPPRRRGDAKDPKTAEPPTRRRRFLSSIPCSPGLTPSVHDQGDLHDCCNRKASAVPAIRPFTIETPEADLEDLRARIGATRWPEMETVEDQSQGVQLDTMQKLARYWLNEYDWRKCEARLKALPNFITRIDGLDIHFIHVRSKHEDALPLIVTHGWPGSVVEQLKIVEPLTNPTAHGGSASDAFHLVIPSIPGYGYSAKPSTTGWGPERIARAWVELMKRLGYTQFAAQGGDWGAVIVDLMAYKSRRGCSAFTPTCPASFQPRSTRPPFQGLPRHRVSQTTRSSRTNVCSTSIKRESPTGSRWGSGRRHYTESRTRRSAWRRISSITTCAAIELITRVFDGQSEGLTRDDVLDNITIAWLTNTAISGARLYWEYFGKGYFNAKGVTIPVAVSVFPDELYPAPRSWTEQAYPKLPPLQPAPERRALRGLRAAGALLPGGPRRPALASLDQ